MSEEPLRQDKVQTVFGAGHRDIEQPALFLDFSARAGPEIGGNAAIDHIEHKHRFPFLPLGGMDRRQDQVVFIKQRYAGLIAGCIRRVEGQFGQKPLARRIAGGDLFELQQIGLPHLGILMNAVEMRFVPETRQFNFGRPAGVRPINALEGFNEGGPIVSERGAPRDSAEAASGSGCSAISIKDTLR